MSDESGNGGPTITEKLEALLARRQVFRTSEAEALGVSRTTLSRMVARGELVQVRRGYYAAAEKLDDGRVVDASDHRAKIAALSVPDIADRVICFETAACLHNLTTRHLGALHLGVKKGTRVFRRQDADQPLRVVVHQWSDSRLLEVGVEPLVMFGRTVYATSKARTVVDLLRLAEAGKGDEALAREALQAACGEQGLSEGDITAVAEELGVLDVVRPWVLGAVRQER